MWDRCALDGFFHPLNTHIIKTDFDAYREKPFLYSSVKQDVCTGVCLWVCFLDLRPDKLMQCSYYNLDFSIFLVRSDLHVKIADS